MAPTQSLAEEASQLTKRYYNSYNCGYGYSYNTGGCSYSSWYYWGRWVVLGVVIFVAILIFLLFACISSRRRRKAGRNPMYGTGWMARGHGPVNYYGPNGQNQQPHYGGYNPNDAPPQYNQPTGNSTAGYYGQQQGVEMQPPADTYQRGGDNVYSPPAGPPPAKH